MAANMRYRESGTTTYATTPLWTQMTALRRLTGLDLAGIQVQATCATWSGATITATLEACIADTSSDGDPPGDSAGWQTIETLSFTANAYKRFGASSNYLVGLQGFQWFRIKGATSSGTPGAAITLSILIDADISV